MLNTFFFNEFDDFSITYDWGTGKKFKVKSLYVFDNINCVGTMSGQYVDNNTLLNQVTLVPSNTTTQFNNNFTTNSNRFEWNNETNGETDSSKGANAGLFIVTSKNFSSILHIQGNTAGIYMIFTSQPSSNNIGGEWMIKLNTVNSEHSFSGEAEQIVKNYKMKIILILPFSLTRKSVDENSTKHGSKISLSAYANNIHELYKNAAFSFT